MTNKWADKLIEAVRYNSNHTHIDSVRVRNDMGDSVSRSTEIISRKNVISQIREGVTFVTIYRQDDSKWAKGALVQITRIGSAEYLKTVADNTTKDNLGDLPEF